MTNPDLEFSLWLASFFGFESVFVAISGRYFSFTLLTLFLMYFLYLRKLKIYFFIIISLILGDQIGAYLKDFFSEFRPCFEYYQYFVDNNLSLKQCGERPTGMPSNHSLNFFLFTTLAFLYSKNKVVLIFMTLISTLVALSRVFLFKHLLSQVVIGAAIGIILGVIFYKLLKRIKWINN